MDAEADDLHMLGEELLQSHLELEGDVVDDDIHPSEAMYRNTWTTRHTFKVGQEGN